MMGWQKEGTADDLTRVGVHNDLDLGLRTLRLEANARSVDITPLQRIDLKRAEWIGRFAPRFEAPKLGDQRRDEILVAHKNALTI